MLRARHTTSCTGVHPLKMLPVADAVVVICFRFFFFNPLVDGEKKA